MHVKTIRPLQDAVQNDGSPMTPEDALALAVYRVGGPRALSTALGLSAYAVSHWTTCPDVHVDAVARLSGVAPECLRRAKERATPE